MEQPQARRQNLKDVSAVVTFMFLPTKLSLYSIDYLGNGVRCLLFFLIDIDNFEVANEIIQNLQLTQKL